MLHSGLLRIAFAFAALTVTAVAAENASATAGQYGHRTLRIGVHGADVRQLQVFLRKLSLMTPQDGYYGRSTASRVRTFELRQHRRPDGKVSPALARMIKMAATQAGSAGNGGTAAETQGTAGSQPTGHATLSADGRTAIAPPDAPPQVKAAIEAANQITDKPYRYGGGHGDFEDTGYDCSGSVSYALHGAALLSRPLDSTEFMSWGKPGSGRWITVLSNPEHAFVLIAGLRFDTSAAGSGESGPRWRRKARPTSGFTARHQFGF